MAFIARGQGVGAPFVFNWSNFKVAIERCARGVAAPNMAQSIDVREARKMKSSSVDLELAPTHSEMNPPARFSAMASQAKDKLRSVGLRPTRTRIALAYMLFARGNRHVSAEMLFEEASQAKVSVSLATVYNTLHEFTKVGFLRQIAVDSSKSYFDTNNTDHYHYYLEDRHELMDIPSTDLAVGRVPMPPEGYEIDRVDVVVRLRRKRKNSQSINSQSERRA